MKKLFWIKLAELTKHDGAQSKRSFYSYLASYEVNITLRTSSIFFRKKITFSLNIKSS